MNKLTVFRSTPDGLVQLNSARTAAISQIPPLTNTQIMRLTQRTGYPCFRLVTYLQRNQGQRTDAVSRDIAIANVSDVVMKERQGLHSMGLDIECKMLSAVNRYNVPIRIGTWWLSVIDPVKWHGESANDTQ